uniref:F-box associated beta-propeller type 1 domain-containing protein n=2 Tax=Brassica TaxID=3705 RepID=A0A0D3DRX6_BRAOL
MDSLPGHLLNKVLFKTDLRALAMLCCTNTSLQSHIHDPSFVSEYYSQIKSSLLHISTYGSPYLVYHHPHSGSRSHKTKNRLMECHILECCSGLLLLFIDDRLCVTNPIRKKFRFLTRRDKRKQLGLVVNQLDRTTQNFKVVYIFEMAKTDETKYGFEINAGDSWTYSKTTLTCHTSNLDDRMKNHVYLNGSLHWLRNDGSIIAFNPETEQARLIQTDFPRGLTSRTLFASGVNSLTLVSANEKVIYVYALRNILSDPKWVLEKQIQNGVIDKNIVTWYVEAYNGKCLVLRTCYDGVVHVYDLSASKWAVMASVPIWYDANLDFFLFTPSLYSVVGLDDILACGDRGISSLSSIMTLVDRSSPENQLMKMSVDEKEEVKLHLGMLFE